MQIATLLQRPLSTFGPIACAGDAAPRREVMLPFTEVAHDPHRPEVLRRTMHAQPPEYFLPYFDGRYPSEQEKNSYIELAVRLLTPARSFANNLYLVEVFESAASGTDFVHLAVSRHDGGTCKEWSHIQRIKNELVGPEYEAIELFPAESRLVDAGNQYHLWVHKDPQFRFPVGWWMRVVRDRPLRLIRDGVDSASQRVC